MLLLPLLLFFALRCRGGGVAERFGLLQGYGTALGLITYLHETGKLERAFYTQSTPYHQGSRCVRRRRRACADADFVHPSELLAAG